MALEVGFEQMATTGAMRKALIFTESRRTQEYLKAFLESQGYQGQVVLFNGTNGGPEATAIYARWAEENRDTGRASGSRAVDVRTALIECFQDKATILLATEAAAEGINLQFCSLVVNYDLPWNPQRIRAAHWPLPPLRPGARCGRDQLPERTQRGRPARPGASDREVQPL